MQLADPHHHSTVSVPSGPRARPPRPSGRGPDGLLDVVVSVFGDLVDASPETLPAAMLASLEAMARCLDVDRAGVVTIDHERESMEMLFEWRSERMPAGFVGEASLPLAAQPVWAEQVQRLEPVWSTDTRALGPDLAVERALQERKGIGATAEIPLAIGGRLHGLVFFDDVQGPRRWEPVEAGLRLFADILASALERQRVDVALRESERRYRLIADNSSDVIGIVDHTSLVLYASPACERALGYRPEELVGKRLFDISHPDDVGHALEIAQGLVDSDDPVRFEHRVVRGDDGTLVWVETVARTTSRDANGRILEIQCVARDVTERRRAAEAIEHLAFHDPLTGLPNRALFLDRLRQALARADRAAETLALLFLDLDRFKDVNDTLGHDVGDALLTAVAERLRTSVRGGDTAARYGGDEFVVLCEPIHSELDAVAVAERITAAMAEPVVIDGRLVQASFSIGVAAAAAGVDVGELLQQADLAVSHAKERGRNRYELFDAELRAMADHRRAVEQGLHRAVDDHEFVVEYQPIADLRTGTVVGFEALVRWDHPEQGRLLPSTFLGVADETGLIVPIADRVLREAVGQLGAWQRRHGRSFTMHVNLAARQLDDQGFVEALAQLLDDAPVAPGALCLEVTEATLTRDADRSVETLGRVRDLGVGVAVDDFGTGPSSLSLLRRFPVSQLKIDRAVISGLGASDGGSGTGVVEALVDLGHVLGLDVVAEGVERDEDLAALRSLGCDQAQGYVLSRPLPASEIDDLLVSGAL